MDWETMLKQTVLGPRAGQQLKDFLLAQLPEFQAPTDVAAWRRKVPRLRRQALARVFLRGYPARVVSARPRVVWGEVLQPDRSYVIRKLRYEAYPNYWIPALLYEPVGLRRRGAPQVPVVLNPNGHHAGGKAVAYKQIRCANLARRGLLALSIEFIGMGELQADHHHNNQAHLNLTGQAGVGLFYLAVKKGLDVLLAHRAADHRRVCVTGLSGGGWQTIVFSALDPRVTMSVPVAGYTAMRARVLCASDAGDLEQAPPDLTTVVDYQELTAMLAPRPALLILNDQDDVGFQTARTRPLIYDAVLPTYRAFGAEDRFATHNNLDPGTHNYEADNRSQFYQFVNRHFGLDTPPGDIHRDDEILPEDQLNVGLPDSQETMLTLALRRARALDKRRRRPRTARQRQALRDRIARVIRLPQYDVQPQRIATGEPGPGTGALYELQIGPWSVPLAVRTERGAGRMVEVIVCDGGRAEYAGVYAPLYQPRGEHDLFVPDILGTGENKCNTADASVLEAAGHRLLGIQVAQILACLGFARQTTGASRVLLEGNGTVSSFATLVAAALHPGLVHTLRVSWETMTLKYLMQWPLTYEGAAPLFCFGFLEVADVPDLLALLEDAVYHPFGRGVNPVVVGWPGRSGNWGGPIHV